VVIRRDVYKRDPWVAVSMYKAVCQAKDHAYRWLAEGGSAKVSFAWVQPLMEREQAIIGRDWYPYGIEPNRPTIEALLQYLHEQGLASRRLAVEELFAASTLRDIPLSEEQLV
jgi:4,5-dihydroxyphthalate decarboxylase